MPKDHPFTRGVPCGLGRQASTQHPLPLGPHARNVPNLAEALRGEDRKQEAGLTTASQLPGPAETEGRGLQQEWAAGSHRSRRWRRVEGPRELPLQPCCFLGKG